MLDLFIKIGTLIGVNLTAYFAYRTVKIELKKRDETRPVIARLSKVNGVIWLIVGNNKPYNVTLKDVYLRKVKFWKFLGKRISLEWNPERDQKLPTDMKERISWMITSLPRYVITDQVKISVKIPPNLPPATYKIFVETTGGSCSTTLFLPSRSES